MILVSHHNNPFKPQAVGESCQVEPGLSIRQVIRALMGTDDFRYPTVCLVNERPILRDKWGKPDLLVTGDKVKFVMQPGDPITILTIVGVSILTSVAIAAISRSNRPGVPSALPEPDSVFSLNGQLNQNRLTFPIPAAYGRNRMWPDEAAKRYNQYIDNDQYQFILLCVGQGQFDIEAFQIEDSPMGSFQDVTYEVTGPGEPVTLFPDNVTTSVEVSNIILYGPNEPQYTGVTGGFVVNEALTTTDRIEVDLTFPAGLYKANGGGGLDPLTVTATFEIRAVDDDGVPLGGWSTLFNFSKTIANNTPQRFTVSTTVVPGRYQVRGVRTSNKDLATTASSDLYWEALRAFLPSTRDYGNVTKLAVRAKATNNLNSNSSNRINVIATRKLRIWDSGTQTWSDYTATRAFGPAFMDIVMAPYGGRLNSSYLDLDGIAALDVIWADRGDTFNFIFDSKSTVWEALTVLARAGRAVPIMYGTKLGMLRDAPKSVPTTMFTPDNIIKGSFRLQQVLADVNEYDGMTIEYTDEDTWKPETVDCLLPGEVGDNLDSMKLPGVTNRAQAYREGMYLRAAARLLRGNVVFKTGLEGHVPIFGDLLGVAYDVPKWGTYGTVTAMDGDELTLSKDVTLEVDQTYQIALRKKDGTLGGPFVVTAGDAANKVICDTAPDPDDYFLDRQHEPLIFQFGKTSLFSKFCVMSSYTPPQNNDDDAEITASIYNDQIFAFDELPVPPLNADTGAPGIPDLPTASNITVAAIAGSTTEVQVSWSPALGALAYILQQSFDGSTWSNVVTTTGITYTLPIITGYLYLRLSAVNVGAGPFTYWEGFTGVAGAIPANEAGISASAWPGLSVTLTWSAIPTAASYKLQIYNSPGAATTLTTRTSNSVGTLTGTTGHGVITGDVADLFWGSSCRRNVVVGTVATNSIPFTGGTGDNLPSTSTAIQIIRRASRLREVLVNALSYTYDIIKARIDGTPIRTLYFKLYGTNNVGDSHLPADTNATNTQCAALTGLGSSLKSSAPALFTYTAQWDPNGEADIYRYRVYGSFTTGFTPGGGNLLYEGSDSEFDIPVAAASSHHAAYYWRAVALDVWGNELTNISAQQTIAAV